MPRLPPPPLELFEHHGRIDILMAQGSTELNNHIILNILPHNNKEYFKNVLACETKKHPLVYQSDTATTHFVNTTIQSTVHFSQKEVDNTMKRSLLL